MRSIGRVILLLIAAVSLSFLGCTNGGNGGGLQIIAMVVADISETIAEVLIYDKNYTPVADASVTINGQNIPYSNDGLYFDTIPTVSGGDSVTLDIQCNESVINASVVMPQALTVTSPASETYPASDSLTVEWNPVSPTPDNIILLVSSSYTIDPAGYPVYRPGSSTSHSIPKNTLKPSTPGITILIWSMNTTSSLGSNTAAGSGFIVINMSESESFSTS